MRGCWKYLSQAYESTLVSLGLLMLSHGSFAANQIIPISQEEMPEENQSFAKTIINVFQKDIIPAIEIFSAIWILYSGIMTMANGVKEAQERQRFDPLKNAIIKTVVVVVVGGALVYLMDRLRTFNFS